MFTLGMRSKGEGARRDIPVFIGHLRGRIGGRGWKTRRRSAGDDDDDGYRESIRGNWRRRDVVGQDSEVLCGGV